MNDLKIQISGLYNLSGLYLDDERYLEAIEVNRESLRLSIITNDLLNQIKSLEAIGSNFSELNKLDSSKRYLTLAYEKAKAIDYEEEKSYLCNNLAGLYLKLNDYTNVEHFLKEARDNATKNKITHSLKDIYANYRDLYFKTKKYEKSLYYFFKYDSIKSLLYDDEITSSTNEMDAKYQSKKKEILLKQTKIELNYQEEKNKQKSRIIWIGAIAIILTTLFLVLAYVNYKKAKKANVVIQSQNQTLAMQKSEVEAQKRIIEHKQIEVLSSIRYAKRIQESLMPTEKFIERIIGASQKEKKES